MNRFAAFALMLVPAVVQAQDFDKGDAAYQAGDYATALQEWGPLAEQGNAEAQYSLGFMYWFGHGVLHDDAEAAKWYKRASLQGMAKASLNLGIMYSGTEGVHWHKLAVKQGSKVSSGFLGRAYLGNGTGVLQDYVSAHMWFNIGAANGDQLSKIQRDGLAKLMSQADVSEAQRRAEVCMASGYKDCD